MASRIAAVAAAAQARGSQGDRPRLGGRLRLAISGGAALSPDIARVFIGLGVPIYQGYGLTEASPVVSSNRPGSNLPSSIGPPLPGIEVKISADGELLTRSRCVMRGYWKNEEATRAIIDAEGWLHTGDKASVDASGHFSIVGRVKDIIILSNGEKVPPTDIESAILLDPLFEQVMVVGEGKPFLAALVVLNEEHWRDFAASLAVDPDNPAVLRDPKVAKALLRRIVTHLRHFPGYALIRRLHADAQALDGGQRPADADPETQARSGARPLSGRGRGDVCWPGSRVIRGTTSLRRPCRVIARLSAAGRVSSKIILEFVPSSWNRRGGSAILLTSS
jgi:long-subunit acyl-CoA synthetase (AMP-forming)